MQTVNLFPCYRTSRPLFLQTQGTWIFMYTLRRLCIVIKKVAPYHLEGGCALSLRKLRLITETFVPYQCTITILISLVANNSFCPIRVLNNSSFRIDLFFVNST